MFLRYISAAVLVAGAGQAQPSALLNILSEELERNFQILKQKSDPPPYFISYSVVEQQTEILSATMGTIQTRSKGGNRLFDVSVRVGSHGLDNYHQIRGERPQFTTSQLLPIEDKADAIKRRVWAATDRTSRLAGQRFINLKTSTEVNVADEDKSDDFSREEPSVYAEPPGKLAPPGGDWPDRLRRLSAELGKQSGILASSVSLQVQHETKYLVNTEGTRIQHGRGFARIVIMASGKASDGMDLVATEHFEAESAASLPKEPELLAAVRRAGNDLKALLDAPVVDPFVGPAILSGRAAGVFFHEIFGHRIEGHRQKDETDGQTFTKSVGKPVLPEFLSVVFDPTRKKAGQVDLNGSYLFDDEGVKARPVKVIENGVLKTFLMSRSPVRGFPQSNGHGRRQGGREVVSRQSNLIVESAKQVTNQRLREMLVEEIKRQGKPYGFLFEHVTGGYTTTGRSGFQSFKVMPLVVYRVYPDGRPDELVRGVDIVGTPLASFAKILATSDQTGIFNGYCGAESGRVPVSAVSPALLVSELEIQKRDKRNDRPPLLNPPVASGGVQ